MKPSAMLPQEQSRAVAWQKYTTKCTHKTEPSYASLSMHEHFAKETCNSHLSKPSLRKSNRYTECQIQASESLYPNITLEEGTSQFRTSTIFGRVHAKKQVIQKWNAAQESKEASRYWRRKRRKYAATCSANLSSVETAGAPVS